MRNANYTRPRLFLSLTTLIVALWFVFNPSVSVNSQKGPEKKIDINGIWNSESGGTYYVRQVGTTVWWLGQSSDGGKSFTNVFNGTRNGDQVTGFWADLPAGRNQGSGTLTLSISWTGSHVEIRKVNETGGFGEWVWKRRVTPLPPGAGEPQPTSRGFCSISGSISRDRPEYQTTLRLLRSDGSSTSFSTRAKFGRYLFTNVPEGTYEVRGSGRYPSEMTPRGPIGLGIFADGSQRVTCEPNGTHTLNFAIRSTEG